MHDAHSSIRPSKMPAFPSINISAGVMVSASPAAADSTVAAGKAARQRGQRNPDVCQPFRLPPPTSLAQHGHDVFSHQDTMPAAGASESQFSRNDKDLSAASPQPGSCTEPNSAFSHNPHSLGKTCQHFSHGLSTQCKTCRRRCHNPSVSGTTLKPAYRGIRLEQQTKPSPIGGLAK